MEYLRYELSLCLREFIKYRNIYRRDKTEIDAAGYPLTAKCRLCDVSYKF
jgi:hypothetical protein